MASDLEKRVAALERIHGLGKIAAIAEKIIYETETTDTGLTACGQTWERLPGESDRSLRKRALNELLESNRRELIRKVCLHQALLMEKTVNGSRYWKKNRTA